MPHRGRVGFSTLIAVEAAAVPAVVAAVVVAAVAATAAAAALVAAPAPVAARWPVFRFEFSRSFPQHF